MQKVKDHREETVAGGDKQEFRSSSNIKLPPFATEEEHKPEKKKKRKVVQYPLNQVMENGEVKDRWDIMFDRLLDFKKVHGHCLVPNRYKEDKSLGSWVSTQRRQYKILISGSSESTPMTPERASRLMEIGFVWQTKDPRHVPWDARIKQLVEFKRLHGHCLVPVGYPPNPKLSNWVSTQRQEKKALDAGRSSRLDQEKVKTLENMGFVWEAQRGGFRKRKDPPPQNQAAASSQNVDNFEADEQQFQASASPATGASTARRIPSSALLGTAASLPFSTEDAHHLDAVGRLSSNLQGSARDMLANRIHPSQQQEFNMAHRMGAEREALLIEAMARERFVQQQQELALVRHMNSMNQSTFRNPFLSGLAMDHQRSLPLALPRAPMMPFAGMGVQQLSIMELAAANQLTDQQSLNAQGLAALLRLSQENPSRRQLHEEMSLIDRAQLASLRYQQNASGDSESESLERESDMTNESKRARRK